MSHPCGIYITGGFYHEKRRQTADVVCARRRSRTALTGDRETGGSAGSAGVLQYEHVCSPSKGMNGASRGRSVACSMST
jgi:hypothetical protein